MPARGVEPDDPASGVRPRKSRSGRWRALVLLLVQAAIALHVAHWYSAGETLSPLEPSEGMEFSKRGVINAGAVFFALTILSTAIFGRFFCGWACHIVALQDGCRWLLVKLGITPRPVQLGVLGSVPWILFVYMFVAPLAVRLYRELAGLQPAVETSVQLSTNVFWETFPGWTMALLTFVVCGGALVYFLGAKGFCTYGCPYGGIFGIADQLAPLRIRVTDACNGCGHCTAVCTSNVRVHQEVRDWKAVVDPGCMKCLDCVSVCPKDALYVGFGAPAVMTRRARGSKLAAARSPRFLRALATGVFIWACFAVLMLHRGQLELGLGYALILAPFATLVAYLFAGKSARPAGPTPLEETVVACAFLLGLFAFRGSIPVPGLDEAVPLLLAVGLAALFAWFALVALRMLRGANVSLHSAELARGRKLTRAGWTVAACAVPLALLAGHGSWTHWRQARERTRLERASAESHALHARGLAQLEARDLPGAIASFESALRVDSSSIEARASLANAYCLAERYPEGIAAYEGLVLSRPDDADVRFLLGLAFAESGDVATAEKHWSEAVRIEPAHAAAREQLAVLCEARGDVEGAGRHRAAAARPAR